MSSLHICMSKGRYNIEFKWQFGHYLPKMPIKISTITTKTKYTVTYNLQVLCIICLLNKDVLHLFSLGIPMVYGLTFQLLP